MKTVRKRKLFIQFISYAFFADLLPSPSVHILSGDLILHKRTLEPLKTMIYGLRRYDVDRCAALIDNSDPKNKDVQAVGFMSLKAKIYLASPVP
jgi:hypothetical protein